MYALFVTESVPRYSAAVTALLRLGYNLAFARTAEQARDLLPRMPWD